MATAPTVAQSFGLAPRGWRRLKPRRPHQQVALLITFYLVVGSAFAATMQPRLADLRRDTSHAEQIQPVLQKFSRWEQSQLQLGSGLVETADAPAAERAQHLTDSAAAFNETQSLWDQYRTAQLGTSVEQRLQRSYTDVYERFSDVGVAILTNPVENTPEQVAEVTSDFEQVRERIRAMREYYEESLATSVRASADNSEATQRWHTWGAAITVSGLVVIAIFVVRSLRRRDRGTVARGYRTELETRLQRALEMIHDESAAYPVVEKAIDLSTGGRPAELLVADSSRAHFHQVVAIDRGGQWSGCSVAAPSECPAAVRGQSQSFHSSTDLDACPYLADRPYGPCSAVCVPLSIAGKTVGVVHTTGPDKQPLDNDSVAALELVARKAGERVGMLRAFSRSQTQAHTDPLTGLLNRRSLEDRAHELDKGSQRYVVAFADLDRFKMLNDVHGHDTGDRALRLFARVLRDSVRPNDIPARYGGEEFVVVLPECDVRDAHAVAERVRDRLAASLSGANVPTFTVSIGLAPYDPSLTFSEMLELADKALLNAKQTGRNRTVVAGQADVEANGLEPVDR